ncbi:iron chelate uptake ABC transporter family permease subunit [Pseudoclavibacter alba]|uniref:Iron chelate uptake ABC transporter family permease subunit n=1 Tax=Pseudoclavibacter albus TaxID=272241 RepID=A0ABT2HV32_9MICO|nr:iron chelate uptake ABC transporter family permease subunit [Pseudoclavibacter alba]MCT2042001.1 iron chelate uptake ABC transporter family permease subunit [Pseudoclavibacter alba]
MANLRSLMARRGLWGLLLAVVLLAVVSLMVGAGTLGADGAPDFLGVSRLPRTLSLLLAGSAIAISGMLMQILSRNRFVEPATAGTNEAAALGVVAVSILAPGVPVSVRLVAAALAALIGTGAFMLILRRVPLRDPLIVPLIGIMLGGVIGAATTMLAIRHDLMQSLSSLSTANFSGVLEGRYELLWLVGLLALVAFVAADRFTVAGLGDDVATNLGVSSGKVLALGLGVVSITVAVVVVHVGALPFLGLIVPNAVSMLLGDNVRRTAPWVALSGAGLTLLCDLIGRLVVYPFEVPAGLVMAVLCAVLFLVMLARKGRRGLA